MEWHSLIPAGCSQISTTQLLSVLCVHGESACVCLVQVACVVCFLSVCVLCECMCCVYVCASCVRQCVCKIHQESLILTDRTLNTLDCKAPPPQTDM